VTWSRTLRSRYLTVILPGFFALLTIDSVDHLSTSTTERAAPRWAAHLIELIGTLLVLSIGAWAAVTPSLQPLQPTGLPSPRLMPPCVANTAGFMRGRLYGSLTASIDWVGPEMTCDGMTRPNDGGIRLVFASPETEDQTRLIIVIGIDGGIEQLENQEEKANITIIDEDSGRFFSTGGQDRCWTTVKSIEPMPTEPGHAFQVGGELYCAGALPSLNGKGSITLGDFLYSGRLSLDDS
jgi:hypothetical protein